MKKIFIILSLILALSSCSIDWNGEKDKKIAELEKQVSELKKEQENDLFEKKQECAKYKKDYEDTGYSIVFYNKQLNTCFVAYNKGGSYIISDIFEGNNYYVGYIGINNASNMDYIANVEKKFDDKVKELNGKGFFTK